MSNMASVQVSTVDTMSPNDTCIRTILDSSTCRVTYTLKGGFGITQNRTNLCGGDNATHSTRGQESHWHVNTMHVPETMKRFGCDGCGKRFGRSDALKRHVLSKSKVHGCPSMM